MAYNFLRQALSIKNSFLCVHDTMDGYSTNFHKNGDVDGWDIYSGTYLYTCWNSILFGSSYGRDPYISRSVNILPIPAENYYIVKILMKITNNNPQKTVGGLTKGRIQWTYVGNSTWDNGKQVDFDLIADDEWHLYTINMGPYRLWQGDISNLRIYPYTDGWSGDQFAIKYIKISSKNKYVCDNTQCSYYLSYTHPCPGGGTRGNCESGLQNETYTVLAGVSDKLSININNYGIEHFDLGTYRNVTATEIAKVIANKIASVNIGCFAFSEVEHSELDKLKIYSGTVGNHSVVEVLDSTAGRALGFYDESGNSISTVTYGTNPSNGFDYTSSRLMTSLEINKLVDGNSNTFAYIHNPDQFNVEGGRRDFNEMGTSKLISSMSTNDYYKSLNNKSKTLIDLSHPINNNGRLKTLYVYGVVDTLSKIKILRPKSDGSYTVIYSLNMPLESGSYMYTTIPINYRVDCDILVEKGDVIGVYNANLYVGVTINGRPDATFQQALGDYDVGETFNGGTIYSFGIAGFAIYGKSDRWQNNVILDIDLGDRVNIEEMNIYGKEDSGEIEFNLAACLDLSWIVNLYGEDHSHSGVNWANGDPWTHTHINKYFGRDCLDDCVTTADNGQQGTSFISGADGMETYGPHTYFYVDGDAEWLYSSECNGKTEYCYLMIPGSSKESITTTSIGGFMRDPISFTLTFPNNVSATIHKSIMYFKERNNFRSVELSTYLGPFGFGGDAYGDSKFNRIPEYTTIKLDGIEYSSTINSEINEYIFNNPTNADLNYTVRGTSKASNWQEYEASIQADWTILEHNFEPIECQGFRLYTNHHNSTKILELELYSKIQTNPSLLDNVSLSFSDYGDVWTDVSFIKINDNKISGFMGGAPRYMRMELNSSTSFELNEIECLVGDQVKLPDCTDVLLLDHAPRNVMSDSSLFSIQNQYDRPFDLKVDIPTEVSDSEDIMFWSTLNSQNDIVDPQLGPSCRLYKNKDYSIGNYKGQCAINVPAYALKNLVNNKKAYKYLYDGIWYNFNQPVLISGVSLDYSNTDRTNYIESVLEFNPVSSKYWKIEFSQYLTFKDIFANYIGTEVGIDKVYFGGQKGTSNPIFTFDSNIGIDTASSDIRTYYSDTFNDVNGTSPDPNKWLSSGSTSTVNNKMRLIADSSTNYANIVTKHAVSGDFSLQVVWNIGANPLVTSWYFAFQLESVDSQLAYRWRRYEVGNIFKSDLYRREVTGEWTNIYTSTAYPYSGTFIISRVDTTLFMADRELDITLESFRLKIYIKCTNNYPTVSVDVDSYTITEGDVASDVAGMKLFGNDPVGTIKLFHSFNSNMDTDIKTSTTNNNDYAFWDTATAPEINNSYWYKYIAIDLERRHDIDIIRNYGNAIDKLWLSTTSNVDYSNTDTSDINNVVWNNSTKNDVRWLRIKLLMGDSIDRVIRKLGIYPNIETAYSLSGGYNCDWYSLGYILSDNYAPVNIAYGSDINNTNNYFRDFYPTNAVDGVSTDYRGQSCWGFDDTTGTPYLEMDFGQLHKINKVVLYHGYSPYDSTYMNVNYNFQVSTTSSGEDFTTVFSITGNSSFTRTHQFDPVYTRRARFNVTSYDYGSLSVLIPETNEYQVFNGSFLREIEVYTYVDLGYIDSETWPVVCMNLLDQFQVTNHAVFNKDISDVSTDWYNNDEYFRYSDGYLNDPHKVSFRRNGNTVQTYYTGESSGDAVYSSEYVFTPEVYLEDGVYNLSWQSYYNQSVGEISLIFNGPDIVEFEAQIISATWATENSQLIIESTGYYTIKAIQNISEENTWGARYVNISRTAGLTKWVSVRCDTAENYSWDDDSSKYGNKYLITLEVYGEEKYNPTEYSWWWTSVISTIDNDYIKVKTGNRSLKIAYPDSTTLDIVQFIEGDHFGQDIVFSAKDTLHMWLYIDDISKLDTTVGDISFGILNDNPQAYYSWNLSSMSLTTGWNNLKLKFEEYNYAYPIQDDEDLSYGHINERLDFRTNNRNLNSIRFRYKGIGSAFNIYVDDIKIERNLFEDEVKFGKGLCLTGYDYLEIPLAGMTLERGAIEFWVKLYTTSYGLDIFGDVNSRSLFTMINNNNDIVSLGIQSGGWFSLNSGHVRKSLNSFELDTTIIPGDITFEIDDVVHLAVVWSNDGKYMGNDDTMRLYINGEKTAVSNTKWAVGDTKSMVIRLGGANTQLAMNKDTFGSAVFDNVKIYNYCKTEFNPNEESIEKDKVYTPNDFVQISKDDTNFYGVGDAELPISFSQVPSGELRTIYVRTNKNENFGRGKTTANLIVEWLTTV